MIRNVVLAKLKPGYDSARMDTVSAGFRTLRIEGMLQLTLGTDAGLRDGNWDLAIVADFDTAEAYRAYDLDAEHDRLREQLAPLVDTIARCQYEL